MNLKTDYLKNFKTPDYLKIIIYSQIIGVATGLGAVLFHNSIEFFNKVFFEKTAAGFYFLGAFAVIVIPAIGMIIQAIMIFSFPELAKRKGVPEVIKAVSIRGGFISFRTTIFQFIAPVICIGSGNTVGPEGPAALIGGGVASKITQYLHLTDSQRRVFTAAGAGSAIAAIFNTPLGGIFFALEVILFNDIQASTFSALILSSVTASTVSRELLGNRSIFNFTSPSVGSFQTFYLYIILGIFAGVISIGFIFYSKSINKLFNKKLINYVPRWILMTIVGLSVGVCGYFYKEIFGIGYHGINSVLSGSILWQAAIVLLAMKFILVPMVINSGGFGGTFAPALFMGACFGLIFASVLENIFGFQIDKTAFVLISMGAFLGGMNSIPIASILIIFEMTKDYSYILPLMLAVVITTIIVQIFFKESIHMQHLRELGYKFSKAKDASILKAITVNEVMSKEVVLLPEDISLEKLLNCLIESQHHTFYTINKDGKLSGTITEDDIRPIITEYEQVRELLVARDVARKEVVTVFNTDPLDHVMMLFDCSNVDEFPVVTIENPENIVGAILKKDVIATYNKENLKNNLAENFAMELKTANKTSLTHVANGYSIVERKIKKEFAGKTILQLKLRNKYGLEALMVKKPNSIYDDKSDIIVPDAKYIFEKDDILVLFGSDENINKTDDWE